MKKLISVINVILITAIIGTSVYAGNDNGPVGSKKTTKISGYVIDKSTGETLTGVKIKTEGDEKVTYTNINGYFEMEVSEDHQVILADFVSYKPVTVTTGSPFMQIELVSKEVIE